MIAQPKSGFTFITAEFSVRPDASCLDVVAINAVHTASVALVCVVQNPVDYSRHVPVKRHNEPPAGSSPSRKKTLQSCSVALVETHLKPSDST